MPDLRNLVCDRYGFRLWFVFSMWLVGGIVSILALEKAFGWI